MKIYNILILFSLFLISTGIVSAIPLLSDDFEDGNSDAWTEVVDDWQIRNGTYCTDMIGGTTGNVGLAMAGSKNWSNYTFKFDVVTRQGANVIGVYILAQEAEAFNFDGYAAAVGFNSEVTLARYINGVPTDLIKQAKPEFTLESGRFHSLKYQKDGDTLRLKVWERDQPEPDWQIQAVDTTYASGIVGVDTWNTRICIDNVNVTVDPFIAKQFVLLDVINLSNNLSYKNDKTRINSVIKHLNNSLSSNFWSNSTHLNFSNGKKVFDEEKKAVAALNNMLKDGKSLIQDNTLENFLGRILEIDYELASIAIEDAVMQGGNNKSIQKAKKELVDGNSDTSEGKFTNAVNRYGNAWQSAIKSIN